MKLIASRDVELVVSQYLRDKGYTVVCADRRNGTTGCDIIATNGGQRILIEVIGFQGVAPVRSREFYECFFRAISRDEDLTGDRLVMALPIRFSEGMHQLKSHYARAWDKIGRAFPNLEIWYVDTKTNTVVERSWKDPEIATPTARPQALLQHQSPPVTERVGLSSNVMKRWQSECRPGWDLATTMHICESADEELEQRNQNPAGAFREARNRRDARYIKAWVKGCGFPWLRRK